MDNLDLLEEFLRVFFRNYTSQQVIQKMTPTLSENNFLKMYFPRTGEKGRSLYSQDDLHGQYRYFQQCMEKERTRNLRSRSLSERSFSEDGLGSLDPMECLFFYVERVLKIQNNQVVCRYERLLNWQMLTLDVSPELLISAFWAMKKRPDEMYASGFSWELVIGHDNDQLNQIFKEQLAENHFHLFGSAPIFQLSWISLMNVLMDTKVTKRLDYYDKNRLNPQLKSDITSQDVPLSIQHLQAAAIRLVLFSFLTKQPVQIGSVKSYSDMMDSCCKNEDCNKCIWYDNNILSYDCIKSIVDKYGMEGFLKRTVLNLEDLLREYRIGENCYFFKLQEQISNLQSIINSFRFFQGQLLPDYAMMSLHGGFKEKNGLKDAIFQGERWLLFNCMHLIYHNLMPPSYVSLFYAYLLIKEQIRQELLHTDDKTGFAHFQDYEKRKLDLIDNHIFNGSMQMAAYTAVRGNILNKNIKYLEIRFTPGMSAEENIKYIKKIDKIVGDEKKRYFYTVHFLKQKDDWHEKDEYVLYCRHYSLRKKIICQANAIIKMREIDPSTAKRIRGIDAASGELDCRPEVFGVAFRKLHGHISKTMDLQQIRRTYHVGEDFQDIVDGLRAIDEAIHFLNMDPGDRLGHAIALGIDVREWYRTKNNIVSLTRQQLLDNVVWLYHKLLKYKLKETVILQEELKQQYSIYFRDIYLRNISKEYVDGILRAYQQDQKLNKENLWKMPHKLNYDIYQYYQAWKLRGDDPELYRSGYFIPPHPLFDDPYCVNKDNFSDPEQFHQRYVPEIFLIHYFYHYNKDIRTQGEKMIQKTVSQAYINGVELVQKEFQREIGRLGIAIETNPTSNVMIGTFKRYDRHPILNFYNRNLEVDPEKLDQNPQLLVSINTDDQGLFNTSLENEFSLMACALEKTLSEDGTYRYPKQRVYTWLDDIRKMGLEQTFSYEKNKKLGETHKKFQKKKHRREADSIMDAYLKSGKSLDEVMTFLNP